MNCRLYKSAVLKPPMAKDISSRQYPLADTWNATEGRRGVAKLDTLYHIRQVNETVPSLLEIVGIWISSWSAALFFFYFAVICKKQADKKP